MKEFTPDSIGWYYLAGGHQISYPVSGIWESTYFDYAKEDMEEGCSERNLVNAVSNAKRALHYQVDALSKAYGYELIKKNNSFPAKLEYLGKCGIAAQGIVRRVNKFRNSIEHDYYLPSKEETEEYLDIVELYLMATHKAATDYPDQPGAELMADDDEYEKSWGWPSYLDILFPEGKGTLQIKSDSLELLNIDITHPEYFRWVSAVVAANLA